MSISAFTWDKMDGFKNKQMRDIFLRDENRRSIYIIARHRTQPNDTKKTSARVIFTQQQHKLWNYLPRDFDEFREPEALGFRDPEALGF